MKRAAIAASAGSRLASRSAAVCAICRRLKALSEGLTGMCESVETTHVRQHIAARLTIATGYSGAALKLIVAADANLLGVSVAGLRQRIINSAPSTYAVSSCTKP